MEIHYVSLLVVQTNTLLRTRTLLSELLQNFQKKLQHFPDSVPKTQFSHHARSSNIKSDFKPLSSPTCMYCKRGHTISECFSLKRKQEGKDLSRPRALISIRPGLKTCIKKN